MVITYSITQSPSYTAVIFTPSYCLYQKLLSGHLGGHLTFRAWRHYEGKPNHGFWYLLNRDGKRKGDPVWYRAAMDMETLGGDGTFWDMVYTIKYEPIFLEVNMGLRPTCWSDPSVGVCKAMIRNKETLNETRLLSSMIYYWFTSLYLSNLQFLMKKNFLKHWIIYDPKPYHFCKFFVLSGVPLTSLLISLTN